MRLASNKRIMASARRIHSASHTVFNQSQPFVNVDLYNSDKGLVDSLSSMGKKYNLNLDIKAISEFGVKSGREELMVAAELAEKNRPVHRQFDNWGRRIDVAEYHPSYHQLMEHGLSHGVAAHGFRVNQPGSQLTRAALLYFENELEAGHCCPVVMTAACIPVLQKISAQVPFAKELVDKIFSQRYDPRSAPVDSKPGVTIGMSMTEKQGGSDVRANTTMATPVDPSKRGIGAGYHLVGHKWFTSAPMCDAFLTLAKTSEHGTAPSCFLVPRYIPGEHTASGVSERNSGFHVMRLKDKLADRANASSEVEYHNAWGVLIGEEGKGVKTIIEMVQATRLDCTLGSAGHAKRALHFALNHTNTRSAFGKKLIEQPLMQNVLTDLCVESEAHTLNAMYMASLYDRYYCPSSQNTAEVETARDLFRIAVSVSKYYVTKRLPNFTYECLEAIGGNGFVEDFPMARLFRHSPLNAVWEGSGNVIALDILRAHAHLPALFGDLARHKGADSRLDSLLTYLHQQVKAFKDDPNGISAQRSARHLVDKLAMALQASILIEHGDAKVAAAYLASRLGSDNIHGTSVGSTCGSHVHDASTCQHIMDRSMPVFSK